MLKLGKCLDGEEESDEVIPWTALASSQSKTKYKTPPSISESSDSILHSNSILTQHPKGGMFLVVKKFFQY